MVLCEKVNYFNSVNSAVVSVLHTDEYEEFLDHYMAIENKGQSRQTRLDGNDSDGEPFEYSVSQKKKAKAALKAFT